MCAGQEQRVRVLQQRATRKPAVQRREGVERLKAQTRLEFSEVLHTVMNEMMMTKCRKDRERKAI